MRTPPLAAFLLIVALFNSTPVYSEWSGNIALETRYFSYEPLFPDQSEDITGSIAFQPEFRQQWDNGSRGFTFIPFIRLDSNDDERTHGDIRELYFLDVDENREWLIGINKVFWGVLEFQHLVDIINQTDGVENIDGEDKLGQPMVHLALNNTAGLFEFFLLPYFRERTFPGSQGRFRSGLVVDTDTVLYQSPDEENHIDFAMRWSEYFGSFDIGLSWFDGTGREPSFIVSNDQSTLLPFYEQIEQLGLDLQYTGEEWLWKLEAIHRDNLNDKFWAAGAGFEYTFVGVNDSDADLGILMEYHYDERDFSQSVFQNDALIGARLAMNDVQSTELLAGFGYDLDGLGQSFRLEASRRIGDNVKINLEAQVFSQIDKENRLFDLRQDDHLQLEIVWYF